MTVRQYKIHTDLDSSNDRVFDVTNGKLRFYAPENLGIIIQNNIWSANGIGVKGSSNIQQPDIKFRVETFGETLSENYQLMTDFIQSILNERFVTLEYTTDNFTVYADIALSEQTKTEGYGANGTFSETIVFQAITKWYTYEKLTFKTVENGPISTGFSKIYAKKNPEDTPETSGYVYSTTPNPRSYTYYGESDISRFSRWVIDDGIFSFTAVMTPVRSANASSYGLSFLDENYNEYTAIILNMPSAPVMIEFNTDVNDEFYRAVVGNTVINCFPQLDFARFRTREFVQGTMKLVNVSNVSMNVKKKVDFI